MTGEQDVQGKTTATAFAIREKRAVFNYLVGEYRKDRPRFFLEAHGEIIRCYGRELQQGKFWMDVKRSKVCHVSGQSQQQIAQRCWRYSGFHCDLKLKLKLNIAWRLFMFWVGDWTRLPSETPDDLQKCPASLSYKQNLWFPEVTLADSITHFCLLYRCPLPKKILISSTTNFSVIEGT